MAKDIALLLADVDGTLVDSQKRLTDRAKAAIAQLNAANINFAITSGRPPRGMRMISDQVELSAPIAAFNGGMLVDQKTFAVLLSQNLKDDVAEQVIDRVEKLGLDVWVYAGTEWYLRNLNAPHREKEEKTVQFPPTVVKDFRQALTQGVAKVVGVSDDYDLVAKAEQAIKAEFEEHVSTHHTVTSRDVHPSVSAARSQPYYLDVTNPNANKGAVVRLLSERLHVPAEKIATIGDMPNDVLMFNVSGFSIAMGQASDQVKRSASAVTSGMDEEGFARAVEEIILR